MTKVSSKKPHNIITHFQKTQEVWKIPQKLQNYHIFQKGHKQQKHI